MRPVDQNGSSSFKPQLYLLHLPVFILMCPKISIPSSLRTACPTTGLQPCDTTWDVSIFTSKSTWCRNSCHAPTPEDTRLHPSQGHPVISLVSVADEASSMPKPLKTGFFGKHLERRGFGCLLRLHDDRHFLLPTLPL